MSSAPPGKTPKTDRGSTRLRLIRAAMRVIQQKGYHGAGTNEILKRAKAPRGSMYHHFRGGKAEVAIACVTQLRADMLAGVERLQAKGLSAADLVSALARDYAVWVEGCNWTEGSLLATLTQDTGADEPAILEAVRDAYAAMQDSLSDMFVADGIPPETAAALALDLISTIEGAQILSRAQRSVAPLERAASRLGDLVRAAAR